MNASDELIKFVLSFVSVILTVTENNDDIWQNIAWRNKDAIFVENSLLEEICFNFCKK